MLIVGPSLIILFFATLFVLFIRGFSKSRRVRVVHEEHLYNRNDEENLKNYKEEEGLYKDERDNQLYSDKVTSEREKNSRAPVKRNDVFFYRKDQPEPECC
jgi:hypothetical protein